MSTLLDRFFIVLLVPGLFVDPVFANAVLSPAPATQQAIGLDESYPERLGTEAMALPLSNAVRTPLEQSHAHESEVHSFEQAVRSPDPWVDERELFKNLEKHFITTIPANHKLMRAVDMVDSVHHKFHPTDLPAVRSLEKYPRLGAVIMPGVGEFVLGEFDVNEPAAIFAPFHQNCHFVAIRAKHGSKIVLGHAHIWPMGYGSSQTSEQQFDWILAQISSSGLQEIEVTFGFTEGLSGFPKEESVDNLVAKAQACGFVVRQPVIRRLGISEDYIASVLLTPIRILIWISGGGTDRFIQDPPTLRQNQSRPATPAGRSGASEQKSSPTSRAA